MDGCQPDCRMATTLIEVCTRKGDTSKALATYQLMKDAGPGSSMVPSVHAYTAAMRAAAEGGAWDKALDIWSDMEQRNCKPTGQYHACALRPLDLRLFAMFAMQQAQPACSHAVTDTACSHIMGCKQTFHRTCTLYGDARFDCPGIVQVGSSHCIPQVGCVVSWSCLCS